MLSSAGDDVAAAATASLAPPAAKAPRPFVLDLSQPAPSMPSVPKIPNFQKAFSSLSSLSSSSSLESPSLGAGGGGGGGAPSVPKIPNFGRALSGASAALSAPAPSGSLSARDATNSKRTAEQPLPRAG